MATKNDPDAALRLIGQMQQQNDVQLADDADDEARELARQINAERALKRAQHAERINAGWLFPWEAAILIAHAAGQDGSHAPEYEVALYKAALSGALKVRDPATRLVSDADTKDRIVALDDLNAWIRSQGLGYQVQVSAPGAAPKGAWETIKHMLSGISIDGSPLAIDGSPLVSEEAQKRYLAERKLCNAQGRYTMREAADVLAEAHGFDSADFIKRRMIPAFKAGTLAVWDPADSGPVRGRECNPYLDIVTPDGINAWLEEDGFAAGVRWPTNTPVATEVQAVDAAEVSTITKNTDETKGRNPGWRMQIQAEAWRYWLTLRAAGCNPSVYGICERMAKWCAEQDIKGGKGQNPTAGTIRNGVLGAGHWTPPAHTVAQAKAHVAQIAQTAQTEVAQIAR